jgi:hypothetical protein
MQRGGRDDRASHHPVSLLDSQADSDSSESLGFCWRADDGRHVVMVVRRNNGFIDVPFEFCRRQAQ